MIGVSAGGMKALSTILPGLPATFRPAVVVVQHLQEGFHSELASILDRISNMPVKEAEASELICGGVIYIAPPGYHLLVERDKTFSLSTDPPVNFARPSIDVLFESAADVFESALAGVILTGANYDGALGLDAVKRAGGLTIVQDPDTAEIATMPRAAIRRGSVDHILPLDALGPFICSLDNSPVGVVPQVPPER